MPVSVFTVNKELNLQTYLLATRTLAHILLARCFWRSRIWLRSRLASWARPSPAWARPVPGREPAGVWLSAKGWTGGWGGRGGRGGQRAKHAAGGTSRCMCFKVLVECMYKVVPGAAGRHRRHHRLRLFSSRGPRCSHTVATTPLRPSTAPRRAAAHGVLSGVGTPHTMPLSGLASPIHPSAHAPNVARLPYQVWAPFARCRRRKGVCVRAARASTSRQSRSSCRC
jgi:hypothetical protein